MTVSSNAIIESNQDEEGFTTLSVAKTSPVDVARHSGVTTTAGRLSADVQGSMGPGKAILVGKDEFGRPIYAYLDWHGEVI